MRIVEGVRVAVSGGLWGLGCVDTVGVHVHVCVRVCLCVCTYMLACVRVYVCKVLLMTSPYEDILLTMLRLN